MNALMIILCAFVTPNFVTCSWYGEPFHGRLTACGEAYDMNAISVAHKTLPIGTVTRFYYNGRSIKAIVNDRGPYISGRDFDLSKAAFEELFGDLDIGVVNNVHYEIIGYRTRDTMLWNMEDWVWKAGNKPRETLPRKSYEEQNAKPFCAKRLRSLIYCLIQRYQNLISIHMKWPPKLIGCSRSNNENHTCFWESYGVGVSTLPLK